MQIINGYYVYFLIFYFISINLCCCFVQRYHFLRKIEKVELVLDSRRDKQSIVVRSVRIRHCKCALPRGRGQQRKDRMYAATNGTKGKWGGKTAASTGQLRWVEEPTNLRPFTASSCAAIERHSGRRNASSGESHVSYTSTLPSWLPVSRYRPDLKKKKRKEKKKEKKKKNEK
jgi:hypothetical protein